MYRHLGGRFLLLASGASGVADIAGGAGQPFAVELALKLLTVPVLVEIVVALGLLTVVIGHRARHLAAAASRPWSVPLAPAIRPTR
jgi:hypothetical protein